VFIDGQQMEETGKVENISDCKQSLTDVDRIEGVPIVAVCKPNVMYSELIPFFTPMI